MNESRLVKECQICSSSQLESVLFLGFVPPANAMPFIGELATEGIYYPLELLRCAHCTLVQIGFEVEQNILFPPSYPYRSSTTKILRENFADLAVESTHQLGLTGSEFVVDIGSNDGTLLQNFSKAGHRVLGIEPSDAAREANLAGIPTEQIFFSSTNAIEIRQRYGSAHLVTAANVFAHMPDVNDIVRAVLVLLDEHGVFISESHYLGGLLESLQHDTIYHEHLRYYSLKSIKWLLSAHGLEIFNIRRIPTHGGSIRVYAARAGMQPVSAAVHELLESEDSSGLSDGSALLTFRRRVTNSKVALYSLLEPLLRSGLAIYGVGAPSRATTLINYLGLNDGILAGVFEVPNSKKVGRYIPGTRIPVISEDSLESCRPDFLLLLSWHIADELVGNLRSKGYRGRFIVPLPEPRIIG